MWPWRKPEKKEAPTATVDTEKTEPTGKTQVRPCTSDLFLEPLWEAKGYFRQRGIVVNAYPVGGQSYDSYTVTASSRAEVKETWRLLCEKREIVWSDDR